MEIKKVTKKDDFKAIGNIYSSSWKTAYKGIVPQEYLDDLSGDKWSPVLANIHNDAFIIMDGEKYVGTSSICAARDSSMEGWGEIISIYLLPEYFGKGYSQPLFDCAINALRNAGYTRVYLWVLEENIRARRFYEKNGFCHNGDSDQITIAGKELTEFRYIKNLEN